MRIMDFRDNREVIKELRDSAQSARLIKRKRFEVRVNTEEGLVRKGVVFY